MNSVALAHCGLSAARAAVFPSVPWQQCQFHLQQNAQAYVPRLDMRASVAADIRYIFNSQDLPFALLCEISEDWLAGKIYLNMNPANLPPN